MSFPKGKGRNLISSNSVAGMYLPAYWLANQNVHWLLNIENLPTPALHKRISLIFLWEFSPEGLLPQYSIHSNIQSVFYGGQWIAQSYLDST